MATICEVFDVTADDLLFNDLHKKSTEESGKMELSSELFISKLDQVIEELRKGSDYKNRNVFDGYVDNSRAYSDEYEHESEVCYDLGWEKLQQGHLSDALDYLDRAAEYGNINAIMVAISVRKEIMDLLDGENWGAYLSELSDFGEKIQQYGQIILAVQSSRFS